MSTLKRDWKANPKTGRPDAGKRCHDPASGPGCNRHEDCSKHPGVAHCWDLDREDCFGC